MNIVMCKDESCHMRVHCFRYRARPNKNKQDYFKESPRRKDECAQYLDVVHMPTKLIAQMRRITSKDIMEE